MRIGGFYQGKETGSVYKLKGFSLRLFTKDFKTLEVQAEYLLKVHKEHAYTYSFPISIEANQESFAKTPPVIRELIEVIEKFVSELTSHGCVLSDPPEEPEPPRSDSSESVPVRLAAPELPARAPNSSLDSSPDLPDAAPSQARTTVSTAADREKVL